LVQTLAAVSDIEVVGEAASLEALAGYTRLPRADVFVMDVRTLLSETEVLAKLHWPHSQRLVLLGNMPSALGEAAFDLLMRQDSFGFLSPDASTSLLISTIRLVGAGSFVCDMGVMKALFGRVQRWASDANAQAMQSGPLSPREQEILGLVAQGLSNAEIARRLVLSAGTVKAHISHMMVKLGIAQRAGLVRYALGRDIAALPAASSKNQSDVL
jgi:DNA-binding NarL/FixJ family response regulator